MGMRCGLVAAAVVVAAMAGRARADGDVVGPIDLTAFDALPGAADPSDVVPYAPTASRTVATDRRWYVSGIVGATFGHLSGDGNLFLIDADAARFDATAFNGGAAVGAALDRPSGLLRVEFEARARGPMARTAVEPIGPDFIAVDQSVTGGWSTMVNVWRDWFLTERLGAYAGGGVGAGGYRYSFLETASFLPGESLSGSSAEAGLAGQVGTGVVYELSERITVDVGYRFFALQAGRTTALLDDGVTPPFPLGDAWNAFSASELLLTVRIYEPFRRLAP